MFFCFRWSFAILRKSVFKRSKMLIKLQEAKRKARKKKHSIEIIEICD